VTHEKGGKSSHEAKEPRQAEFPMKKERGHEDSEKKRLVNTMIGTSVRGGVETTKSKENGNCEERGGSRKNH